MKSNEQIREILKERIMVLDGAMGSMLHDINRRKMIFAAKDLKITIYRFRVIMITLITRLDVVQEFTKLIMLG